MTKASGPGRFPLAFACGLAAAIISGPAFAALCTQGPVVDAARNAASYNALIGSFFGRIERGWAVYEPLIMREIGTDCPGPSAGFAAALAKWKAARGLSGSGVLDGQTLTFLRQLWSQRRPFVAVSKRACPAPPAESTLTRAAPSQSYGGKAIELRPAALAAYRRMVTEAKRSPGMPADPRLFAIFSGYRSPAYDAARCAAQQNCQGVVRASCSPHRTGLALDMYLGAAPGYGPDSSADVNRVFLSRSAAYRWLVRNASRFGFVNYPFEPWHWEWTGEPP